MLTSRTLKRLMLATLGALLLALAAVATAGAAWKAPTYITPSFIPAETSAEVAMDANGDSYFTYALGDGRVQARKYTPTGASAWTKTLTPRPANPEQEISGELPNGAVNSAGDSAYVWLTSNNAGTRSILQTRTLSRTGVLGQVKTVLDIGQSEGEVDLPEIAVDADGDAVVAWTQVSVTGAERGQVRARALSKTGVLGPVQTISQDAAGAVAEFVQVDMRPNGDAVFAWSYSTPNADQIQSRTRTAAGNLTPVRNISRLESTLPAFAMAPDGDAVVAWLYADPFAGGLIVQTRRISATGTLGAIKNVSPRGAEAHDVHVGINDAGTIAVIWSQKDPISGKDQIKGRTLTPTDALNKVHDLVPNALESPTDPQVGISSAGQVVFAWQFHASNDRVQSKTLTPTGTLSSTKTVGTALSMGIESHLAVAPSGQAAATWADLDVKRLGAAFGP